MTTLEWCWNRATGVYSVGVGGFMVRGVTEVEVEASSAPDLLWAGMVEPMVWLSMPVHDEPPKPLWCAKGHTIRDKDVLSADGELLPCGCPVTSVEGRLAEGMR